MFTFRKIPHDLKRGTKGDRNSRSVKQMALTKAKKELWIVNSIEFTFQPISNFGFFETSASFQTWLDCHRPETRRFKSRSLKVKSKRKKPKWKIYRPWRLRRYWTNSNWRTCAGPEPFRKDGVSWSTTMRSSKVTSLFLSDWERAHLIGHHHLVVDEFARN